VFVRDLHTKATRRIDIEGHPAVRVWAISPNGRFAVLSAAGLSGVYKYDVQNGTAVRLPVNAPSSDAQDTAISDDGNTVFVDEALLQGSQPLASLVCPDGKAVAWGGVLSASMDASGKQLLFTTDRCGSPKMSAYKQDFVARTTQALYTGTGCDNWIGNVCVQDVLLSRDGKHYVLSVPGHPKAGVPDYIIVDGARIQLNDTSVPYGGLLCGLGDDGKSVVMSLGDRLAAWQQGSSSLNAVRAERNGLELCRRGSVASGGAVAYFRDNQAYFIGSAGEPPTPPVDLPSTPPVTSPASKITVSASKAFVGETTAFTYVCQGGGAVTVRAPDGSPTSQQVRLSVTRDRVNHSSAVTWQAAGTFVLSLACGPATVASAPVVISTRNYVAMGDSYSSGEANDPFDAGTVVDGNGCHRSSLAWPRYLGVSSEWHLACSGAVIENLTSGQMPAAPDNQGQIARLRAIENGLAASGRHVDVVTLTIGGNDVGFGTIVRDCWYRECLAHPERIAAVVQQQRARITSAIREIGRAAREAKVYLVGYPRILPGQQANNVTCGWLTPRERQRLNTVAADMDVMARQAARSAQVRYISVRDALDGHELCARDSWMYSISPTEYGSDQRQAHPVGPGQVAMAEIVAKVID
jgi:lysophospholipase L1-like esterase